MTPLLMVPMLRRPPAVPGSITIAATGNFTLPNYDNLTIVAEGARGADGSALDYNGEWFQGGAGGGGGRASSTYTFADGPAAGSTLALTIANGSASGAGLIANRGGDGGNAYEVQGGPVGEPTYYGASGSPGAPGAASGGQVNTAGGSTSATARIIISWS